MPTTFRIHAELVAGVRHRLAAKGAADEHDLEELRMLERVLLEWDEEAEHYRELPNARHELHMTEKDLRCIGAGVASPEAWKVAKDAAVVLHERAIRRYGAAAAAVIAHEQGPVEPPTRRLYPPLR
jgi:hypothetical protein